MSGRLLTAFHTCPFLRSTLGCCLPGGLHSYLLGRLFAPGSTLSPSSLHKPAFFSLFDYPVGFGSRFRDAFCCLICIWLISLIEKRQLRLPGDLSLILLKFKFV